MAPATASSRLTPFFAPIPSSVSGSGFSQQIQPPAHSPYRTGLGGRADNVETITVTNIMSSPSINRLGSLFSSINKSVGSAISNLMASQYPGQATVVTVGQKPDQRTQILPTFGSGAEQFGSQQRPCSAVPSVNSHSIDGFSSSSGVGSRVYPTGLPPVMQGVSGHGVVMIAATAGPYDISNAQPKTVVMSKDQQQRQPVQSILPPSTTTKSAAPGRETNGQMVDWSGGGGGGGGTTSASRPPQVHIRQMPLAPSRLHSPSMPNVAMSSGQNLPASQNQSHMAVSPRLRRG